MGPKQGKSRPEAAAALGMTRQSLWDHEQRGHVVLFPDRSVDVEATRVRIDTMRDNRGGKFPRPDKPAGEPAGTGADARAPADDGGEGEIPPEALGLSSMEVERRRKIAVMLKAEADARTAQMEADEVEGGLVPSDLADKTILEAGMMVRAAFEADAEQSCADLHAQFGIPLMEARAWLIERDRKVLTRCADDLSTR